MDLDLLSLPDVDTVFLSLVQVASGFYSSWFVLGLKIVLGIYTAVLLVDIILLLILRGIRGNVRTGLRGMDIPIVSQTTMGKRWKKIVARLETGNESQYKVAVIEADAMADEMLAAIGYKGENMAERLAQIKPGQLDYLEELTQAHQIRNQIVHDAQFRVDKDLAKDTVAIYENFLRYLEFLA